MVLQDSLKLKEKFIEEQSELLKTHEEYIREMKNDFNHLKQKHQMELKDLQRNYEELYKCYEKRPSRPQDKNNIQRLQTELSSLRAELLRLKLEMNNREGTYNKILAGKRYTDDLQYSFNSGTVIKTEGGVGSSNVFN